MSVLLTWCEDIFLARQMQELVLEEELYKELISVFRSQERLIEVTDLYKKNQ